MAKTYDHLFKLLLIGDFHVGKTSLMDRFSENGGLTNTLTSTIGIDFIVRTINLDGKKIKLQIWDTAGQERFQTITTSYYRDAKGIMFVYDITDEKSFKNIKNWIRNFKDWNRKVMALEEIENPFMECSEEVELLLIGNKCHLETERQVSYEQGEQLSLEYGIKFIETSAETNVRVEVAFLTLARGIKDRMDKNLEASNSSNVGAPLTASETQKQPTNWFSRCILL